jgi:uncharacterized iron-regulated membrane protein
MSNRMRRIWGWVHTWSSLVCTVFMLLLCLTGLPLIFSDEIDELQGKGFAQAAMPAETPRATADAVAASAVNRFPGKVPLYLFAEEDAPDLWYVKLDTRVDTDETKAVLVGVDARTAEVLGVPEFGQGFMSVMYRLHVDLYAGLWGKLFLGAMGLLLVVALVSGIVLYPPFMRKLDFGTVRHERSSRIRWLDLHNLLGAVTLCWALVVGATGVVNTWAELILKAWQREQMATLAAGRASVILPGDVQRSESDRDLPTAQFVLRRALAAEPDMTLRMMAWPGTLLSTRDHYAVILHGNTPLTKRLRQALLVDPKTGDVLRASARPWYVTIFQLSQPLHFGDYGGLPLKLLWAMLDVLTLVVLGSGLYLWIARRRWRASDATSVSSRHEDTVANTL